MEPCCTRVQTPVALGKRNTDFVLNECVEREKYDGERTPDSQNAAQAFCGDVENEPPACAARLDVSQPG
jgi:hypothetical protein